MSSFNHENKSIVYRITFILTFLFLMLLQYAKEILLLTITCILAYVAYAVFKEDKKDVHESVAEEQAVAPSTKVLIDCKDGKIHECDSVEKARSFYKCQNAGARDIYITRSPDCTEL